MTEEEDAAAAPAPTKLVVDAKPAPGDSSSGSGTAMLPYVAPVFLAGGLAKFVSPTVGLLSLGGSVVLLLLLRKPKLGRFVLRIDGDALEVSQERSLTPPERVALADLVDVTLDRAAHASGGRGGAAERVRLALERPAPAGPIYVPDERITPIEAQEWYGKVRVFLRKHGWIPHNERGGT